MAKSPDAFRTITEVSKWLGTQAHVLRFWESKFAEIAPVKRAGGRRYYRPEDMRLIGGLKQLLHHDGLTIKGAQKVIAEKGVAHVRSLSPALDFEKAAQSEKETPEIVKARSAEAIKNNPEKVIPFQKKPAKDSDQLFLLPEIENDITAPKPAPPIEDAEPVHEDNIDNIFDSRQFSFLPDDDAASEPENEQPEPALETVPEPKEKQVFGAELAKTDLAVSHFQPSKGPFVRLFDLPRRNRKKLAQQNSDVLDQLKQQLAARS